MSNSFAFLRWNIPDSIKNNYLLSSPVIVNNNQEKRNYCWNDDKNCD